MQVCKLKIMNCELDLNKMLINTNTTPSVNADTKNEYQSKRGNMGRTLYM